MGTFLDPPARTPAAVPALLLAALALPAAPPPRDAPTPAAPAAEPPAAAALPDGLNERERLSYALGVNLGRSLLADGLDPEPTLLIAGLGDTLAARPQRMTDEEVAALLAAAAERVREAAATARRQDDERRAARSRSEFETFTKAEGAARLSPGVWAKVTEPGDGPKPAADGRVTLHYAASVAGEPERPIFTTAGRDPVTVPVASLLPGLKAALPTLPVGTAATLALAPAAGYGAAGGPGVPPNAALFVSVELRAALPPAAEPAAGEAP